jgi:hypothetical protein
MEPLPVRCIVLPASLLVLLAATPALAASNALINGSFEPCPAPAVSLTPRAAAVPGWISRGRVHWRDATADGFLAPNGDWLVEFPTRTVGGASLQQTFATVPGVLYELRFWLGSRTGADGPGATCLEVEVAGAHELASIDNASSELLWQAHVVPFLATAPATTLTFRALGPGAAAYLDAVAVGPKPLVPEVAPESR